ncbi:hypothetical protein LT42_09130 [Pseudomonas lutea]|jgi:hypothetical protein|uniref:Uncharacterized protein n=1 Tax=Pseudomonas lutea TaxID=243924 RepID=A0A9X0EHW9_9PSED|nr:hypothetical protein LT42_09130 [Pseudomonas lutea]
MPYAHPVNEAGAKVSTGINPVLGNVSSTLIKDTHSGDRFRIAGHAGSQSARTTMSTLALAYAF